MKHGIDDLNERYEVRVEGGRMEYDCDERIENLGKKVKLRKM